jgi:hypothetical protein
MKTESAKSSSTATAAPRNGEPSKLVSLLALATGAVAMPQTGNADIIYTDLSSNPGMVGFGSGAGSSYATTDLPGTAQLTFGTRRRPTYLSIRYSQTIIAVPPGNLAAMQVGADNWALHRAKGAAWTNLPLYYNVPVAKAIYYAHAPASYGQSEHEYLSWVFSDTTHAGASRYGWVEVSLDNANLVVSDFYPTLTIYGYAYDNTGAKIAMGAGVPEPAPAALMALGALALGAKGLRAWRRNRAATSRS